MVLFQPFRGYVYNPSEIRAHGALLTAPPYDVLTPEERERYYQGSEHNFLHVDLGRVLASDSDGMAWHARAATLLSKWLKDGVLVRTERPSFYLVDTLYTHPLSGHKVTRHGLLGLMRLEHPGKDANIRLHEQTFSFHRMERLDLMLKTQAQLSPIFGFFPDRGDLCLKSLKGLASGRSPDIFIKEPGGDEHRVYLLNKPEDIALLSGALADNTVYIADGHHRYMTALSYRDEIKKKLQEEGAPPPPLGSALDYVMTYLSPMGDPGLSVLPTHRILKHSGLTNDEIISRIKPYAEIRAVTFNDGGRRYAVDRLLNKLQEDAKKGLTVFGLFLKDADYCSFIKIKEKVKEQIVKDAPEKSSLSLLDVSILTSVILKKALSLTEECMDDPDCISYISRVDEALNHVDRGDRAAFILNPTSLSDILKVTESGYVMPRKATYFYPKVRNGLVINVVNPEEVVEGTVSLEGEASAC
ncbi:MAG: DUF1015 domain-containing protein [Deltaproteobacteria bacterium]|jgi:uncharacterized protein (DUF1015 family)|nr:DUF1015 domain-containing protein [Deltaproteobacteria bacterium]